MTLNLDLPADGIPHALSDPANSALLTGILRGVEKENLRVTTEGKIALSPHPVGLGSALTHPQITTDFSEALLEFITPPSHRVDTVMQQLDVIHRYTYRELGDDMLWSSSMPCALGDDAEIPVAFYGNSNRGQMKTVYRLGLGHRYGRTMQTVAGIHYNFSLPPSFWAFLHQQENSVEDLPRFSTARYFDLIRNFRRYYWLLIYLFGASPAICSSFAKGRDHNLQPLGNDGSTLHLPYATSLRMGDLGYQSSAQESLFVCYNNLQTYVRTLVDAISHPYAPYEAIGLTDADGRYRQLSTGLLQIENEFYSAIRPKRTARAGETALTALCHRGVEYIEVRCLDLNPYEPLGITAQQMRFLDVFLLYCVLKSSPAASAQEFQIILNNQKRVVTEGRRPGLSLTSIDGEAVPLRDWAQQLLEALEPVARVLDTAHGHQLHSQALAAQQVKVVDPELTPSARVIEDLKSHQGGFAHWTLQRSLAMKAEFLARPLSDNLIKRYEDMATESWALQRADESMEDSDFASYLHRYFAQYTTCCGSLYGSGRSALLLNN